MGKIIHKNLLELLPYIFPFSFCFFNFWTILATLATIPKKPTVPLLILVLTIISGILVLAIAGTPSPIKLINYIAINLLS